jgi:hypothetical protein
MEDEQRFSTKRAAVRFNLQLPVGLHKDNGEAHVVPGVTRDISSQGICFLIEGSIEPGATIQFTLTLPTEITLTEPITVLCHARVLRVEQNQPDGRTAIAASILRYEYQAPQTI